MTLLETLAVCVSAKSLRVSLRGKSRRASRNSRLSLELLEDRWALAQDVVLEWNAIALEALKNDYNLGHTHDQGGPTRDSRALAIVHAAMYDAANSIKGTHTPYLAVAPNAKGASLEAAVAQAAHDTLVQLYPSQIAMFDAALTSTIGNAPKGRAENKGIAVGQYVAAAILADRADDGSNLTQEHDPIGLPGHHQPDPLHPDQGFLTPKWGLVTPFAIPDMTEFLSPPPPALDSALYTAAFAEVATLGGDGDTTETLRTAEQTEIGIYWGYDGSPGLGTPPRLYNQIARTVAEQEHNKVFENARLFALVNIAMADAGIQAWDVKYVYDLWRPVVAIRAAHTDGNPLTDQVADWTPLGAPRSNDPGGTNFTPPFPAYTSGHATFGAATFRTLADFYGRDDISFSFTSDEFNGVTRDQDGTIRPVVTRTYDSFSEASEENGQSRIYLGIHWSFDKVQGIDAGNAIADYVFANLLLPLGHGRGHGHGVLAPAAAGAVTVTAQPIGQALVSEAFARQATSLATSNAVGIGITIAKVPSAIAAVSAMEPGTRPGASFGSTRGAYNGLAYQPLYAHLAANEGVTAHTLFGTRPGEHSGSARRTDSSSADRLFAMLAADEEFNWI